MLGAIIGDIVGSIYEFDNIRTKNFEFFNKKCFFTDDTVMTVAICNALMKCNNDFTNLEQFAIDEMQKYGHIYPYMSYGNSFRNWLSAKNPMPYNSFGNGAGMRVSPVAYFSKTLEECKKLSKIVTSVTHNHSEGIKGAEATATCVWLAIHNYSKEYIKKYVEDNYYSLDFNYENLKKNYYFNEICQDTVPQAIYCFLISENFEDAIRTGISIGGDSDTLCAIIGAIAEAFYGIPKEIQQTALTYLDDRILNDYTRFLEKIKNN